MCSIFQPYSKVTLQIPPFRNGIRVAESCIGAHAQCCIHPAPFFKMNSQGVVSLLETKTTAVYGLYGYDRIRCSSQQ